MPLSAGDKHNFDSLRRAMLAGDAALLECQQVATGSPVAVICAANRLPGGGADFVPLPPGRSGRTGPAPTGRVPVSQRPDERQHRDAAQCRSNQRQRS